MKPIQVVCVGARFQECDRRFYRVVEVVKVKGKKVKIQTVSSDCGGSAFDLECDKRHRQTWANKDRFDGRSHGYRRLWGYCHACQIARGGVVPSWGHIGITISLGTCSQCLKRDADLVPSCDYNWPKEGLKAIWD